VGQVKTKDLYFDGFDELPLNEILDLRGRRIEFIIECLAIHPSYNSIGDDFEMISDSFFKNI
jgi:hypothetical protein